VRRHPRGVLRGGAEIAIRPVSFFADGLKLDGDLRLPPDHREGERRPALLFLSGYTGMKIGVPRVWAPPFVERGYVALGIDYRGYNESEGLRGRVAPQDEVEDVRAAVSLLQTVPEVDPERIGVFGWALGGSIAIMEAADDPRVKAVATVHALGDVGRGMRRLHGEESWAAINERIAEDRRRRALGEPSELVDPFDIYPLDPDSDAIVRTWYDGRMPNYGSPVSLETGDLLYRFRPELVVDRIAPRSLLLVHGGANRLHDPDESRRLFARASEPKRLAILEGKAHLDFSHERDPDTFYAVVDLVDEFFAEALARP